ncbi:MAG: anthranilate synthase component I [Candidatus Margulisbacteria bacterium]|nr:anthranilate synthase component I [Candidatus Margulisiibacteriota bacterium]
MYYPSEKEFIRLAKKGNLIPVYKEIVADMETPVSAFRKIEGQYSFLLESVEGGENIARYSFLGTSEQPRSARPKTFAEIREMLKLFKPVRIPGLPRFCGGLVGYVSYDAVRQIEKLPNTNPDDLKLPLMQFIVAETLLAFDHVKHKIIIIANAHVKKNPKQAYRQACARISAIEKKLKRNIRPAREEFALPSQMKNSDKFSSNLTKFQFENMVKIAKGHIRAGDIIQVVLSQRLETKSSADPFNVYRVLRMINPSPYMYYLKLGAVRIIGSSPEVMVRLENGMATLRPIAGTRRRGKDDAEDKKLMDELLASKKERAEHIMLVDLGRNDLGRVCDYGSVKVTEEMAIEKYSHVMHIVSNVTGKLKRGKDAVSLFKACFPAGTVSGAPKVRAMEIIDELENRQRGLYAGSVGYFSFSGDLDSGIAIRTILIKDGKAYVQAGAGLVADSVPAKEYQETLNKARALLNAVEYSK